MPLVWDKNKKSYDLKCLNDIRHLNDDDESRAMLQKAADAANVHDNLFAKHEMQMATGWVGVYGVAPPDQAKGGIAQITAHGIPLRAFVCQSCGYVEFYDDFPSEVVDGKRPKN